MKGMLLGVGALVLPAWSRSFEVAVVGRAGADVTFSFLENGRPLRIDLLRLTVHERSGEKEGPLVWHVHGRHACTSIGYGERIDGLEVAVPAQTLMRDKSYGFVVTAGATWLAPIGYSGGIFRFDPVTGTAL